MDALVFPFGLTGLICLLLSFPKISTATDAIYHGQIMSDGMSLSSKDGNFQLCFFNPSNYHHRYLGIWSKYNKTITWVANLQNPIKGSSGFLIINSTGNAVLFSQSKVVVWSTNSSKKALNPLLQLLDSGNLVLRDEKDKNSKNFLWQSFNFLSDTLLTTMNPKWVSSKVLNRRLSESPWRVHDSDSSDYYCGNHGLCGPFGICDISQSTACDCLKGFKPRIPEDWKTNNRRGGCERIKQLNCEGNDAFIKYEGVKLPDTKNSLTNKSMNLKECKATCLRNCSCVAYSSSDIEGGSDCIIWYNDLFDIILQSDSEKYLYVRMAASEKEKKKSSKVKIGVIAATVFSIVFGILIAIYYIRRQKKRTKLEEKMSINENEHKSQEVEEDMDVPLFSLSMITRATDDFSFKNKLGAGGFGAVYRGILDGQDIAVKRLSRSSGQGMNEFKNEVKLIAKLQHRNLVRLLGCCIQGDEKLLIYEYLSNRSLDFYIFDQKAAKLLDWSKRFNIIFGVARGLLYLHEDSRLRIIHRDLKASNVLLDDKMNPKISDFGMARIFGGDQTNDVTSRVVGTYGYMAPEYAIDGQFSVKSDVFSFGILVLEIISGKKNRGFHLPNSNLNLIGYAWTLWNEERSSELIDESMKDSCTFSEAIRCIHVSLLCLQELPQDRPTMSSVLVMLGDESALPLPKKPGFFAGRFYSSEADSSSRNQETSSTNENYVTEVKPR